MKSLIPRSPQALLAVVSLALLAGACSNRSQGLAGGQNVAADAWSKPDRYWSGYLQKKPASAAAGGRTYYASPAGNDQNSGTSGSPWRTLQRASVTMEPGDTLLIEDGEYPGGIKHRVAGAPGRPITYRALNPGRAIIRGDEQGPVYGPNQFKPGRRPAGGGRQGQNPVPDAILITGAGNIVVEGLVVHHAERAGIRIDQSNNVTVRYCRFMQNGTWGIFTDYSDDLLLEYNECAYSEKQHGIYVSNSGDRPVLRYNTCHDNTRAGIQLNGDSKQQKPELGKRGDGIIEDAVIEGNVLYENGSGGAAGLNLACVHGGKIVNNLIFNNKAGGIALFNDHRRDVTEFGSKNNRILHNTIYFRPGEGRFCISIKHGSTDNVIRNNILSGGRYGAYEFDDTSSFTADYNVLWSAGDPVVAADEDTNVKSSAAEWKKQGKNDLHSVWAEPQFASAKKAPFDFRPLPASPASGKAAEELGIASDLEGKVRVKGVKRSIGALEAAPK